LPNVESGVHEGDLVDGGRITQELCFDHFSAPHSAVGSAKLRLVYDDGLGRRRGVRKKAV